MGHGRTSNFQLLGIYTWRSLMINCRVSAANHGQQSCVRLFARKVVLVIIVFCKKFCVFARFLLSGAHRSAQLCRLAQVRLNVQAGQVTWHWVYVLGGLGLTAVTERHTGKRLVAQMSKRAPTPTQAN